MLLLKSALIADSNSACTQLEMLGKYQIWLDGKARHVVEGSSSDTGVMQRIKHAVENIGEELETNKQLVDQLINELKQAKEDAEKKFPKQDELNKNGIASV